MLLPIAVPSEEPPPSPNEKEEENGDDDCDELKVNEVGARGGTVAAAAAERSVLSPFPSLPSSAAAPPVAPTNEKLVA